MTDTEILDWLEQNMTEHLIVPPTPKHRRIDGITGEVGNNWSIYYRMVSHIASANSLREVVEFAAPIMKDSNDG